MTDLPKTAAYNLEKMSRGMAQAPPGSLLALSDAMRDELLGRIDELEFQTATKDNEDAIDNLKAEVERLTVNINADIMYKARAEKAEAELVRTMEKLGETLARVAELEEEPKFQHGVLTCPYCGTIMRLEMGQIAEWTHPGAEHQQHLTFASGVDPR